MSIVTFWNGTKEQCGSTSSAVAVASQMAIDHNLKILLISTSLNDKLIKECFWQPPKKTLMSGIFGANVNGVEKNGIEGLDRIIRSNKITPDIITDYTRIVLKNRLEILLGMENTGEQYDIMKERYSKIISFADRYYDMVIVDLDKRLGKYQEEILKMSNVVVAVIPQREKQINDIVQMIEKEEMLKKGNTILTIGRYMENTKYNAKNITRGILKQKNTINTIPYNNLFFEASQEGKVIDLFLNLMRIKEKDSNYTFVTEIKKLIEEIQMRIKLLQMESQV